MSQPIALPVQTISENEVQKASRLRDSLQRRTDPDALKYLPGHQFRNCGDRGQSTGVPDTHCHLSTSGPGFPAFLGVVFGRISSGGAPATRERSHQKQSTKPRGPQLLPTCLHAPRRSCSEREIFSGEKKRSFKGAGAGQLSAQLPHLFCLFPSSWCRALRWERTAELALAGSC